MAKEKKEKLSGSLKERLLKNSTIDQTAILEDSVFFEPKDAIDIDIPLINVALSGYIKGGLYPGVTVFAGPSKHFKTAFTLLLIRAFQKKYPEGIVLFYDSEFGSPQSYFDAFGCDMSRIIHTPITDIEVLKHDAVTQLDMLARTDQVMIAIDSIGNLASKKEVDDALEGKSVADMTRAKAIKSLFRMITPHLMMKNIPLVAVNHTYDSMEMFSKPIVSGGTGPYYSADTIWILGRQQVKEGDELTGYNFIINIEKSRYVQEKSRIPITVTFEGGVKKWSGMFDLALELGWITKSGNSYCEVDQETGEPLEETKASKKNLENNGDFWSQLLNKGFDKAIEKNYLLVYGDQDGTN